MSNTSIDDGFGNSWLKCELKAGCGMHVVRPGKAQCWCLTLDSAKGKVSELQEEVAVANNWVTHHQNHVDDLIKENVALRERLHNADCEIDMWASRCAAAIWMLPEQVTGGQLREAQDKFHRMLHAARKEAQP